MQRTLATALFSLSCLISLPVLAQPAPEIVCGEPACGAPSLSKPPAYSAEISRSGDFSTEIAIHQPCSCVRHLSFLVAFTAQGAKTSRERVFKIDVTPGRSTMKLAMSNAELAKAKVPPGRYTVGFALYDEHEKLAGAAITGQPFTFGTSQEALTAKPVLPKSISSGGELAVPFVFSNDGDISTRVTALLVFTRPDETSGIEIYKKDLIVPPRGAKHVVKLSAAERGKLHIGTGAWLVTTSAFDGVAQRLATFPGHLLTIGKVLSLASAPIAPASIEQPQDLPVMFTLKNDSDHEELVTAVLIFSQTGAVASVEYKVEGQRVPPGLSSHTVTLTATDRYNLGIRPGRWHVAATALDRPGKRLAKKRGNDVVIIDNRPIR